MVGVEAGLLVRRHRPVLRCEAQAFDEEGRQTQRAPPEAGRQARGTLVLGLMALMEKSVARPTVVVV